MRMKSKVAFHILFIYFGELSDNLIPKINDINVRSWLVCKWTKITSGFWEDLCILLSNQLLHKGIQLVIKRPLFYFIVKMDFIVMGIRESWQLLGRSSFPTKETKESSFYLNEDSYFFLNSYYWGWLTHGNLSKNKSEKTSILLLKEFRNPVPTAKEDPPIYMGNQQSKLFTIDTLTL